MIIFYYFDIILPLRKIKVNTKFVNYTKKLVFYERNYEMKNTKGLIRLSALVLVIAIALSLSSCTMDFNLYEDFFNGTFPDIGDDDKDNNIPDFGIFDDTIESENYGDFYPGSGESSLDNVSPMTKTLLSTVTIVADFGKSAGAGSGVFYSVDKINGDAYVITNYHVVYTKDYGVADEISLYLYGMELSSYAIPATLVGGSITYDIAVLKIEKNDVIKNSYATPVTFGDSDLVRVFDTVFAVGNAEANGMSATKGMVSVESESLQLEGADESIISLRVMRFDAAVNHGNSGGGLYDTDGKLIGIVSAKDVSADVDNIGYAIPSNLAKLLAENIIHYCDGNTSTKVSKALLGITITAYVSGLHVDPETGDISQVDMVEVIEVTKGSIADGKVLVGDIINRISVNGVTRPVTKIHHVTDFMLAAREGQTVSLDITRGEEKVTLSFQITEDEISTVK